MVILYTIAILVFLFCLGFPLSFFCLRERKPSPYLLLAPHCGLAVLAIIAINAYLLDVSVSRIVFPVIGLCLLNGIGTVWHLFKRLRRLQKSFASLVSGIIPSGRGFLIPTFLFGVTLLVYILPFILYPNMVFYAYSGTDGYAYISTAEHQMNHGIYGSPSVDLWHVYSGLIVPFTETHRVEKPGTMMVLAFFSSLFSRLPHEIFSPLMLAYTLLIFLSVFALAKSLDFSQTLSGLAGFLSTLSLPVLALASNTYFSATITVSLLPIILILVQDMWVNRKHGLLFVIVYTAYFLFSPPSLLIPVAASFLYMAYAGFQHLRRGAKTIIANGIFLIGSLFIFNLLTYKLFIGALSYYFSHAFVSRSVPMEGWLRRYSWNWFWHTLGVGPIVASPATKLETLSYIVLGIIVLIGFLYLVRSVLRRDFSVLFFSYLSYWLVVLIGGLAGVFRSFEVLPRVSQQFVPLHSLVYLSFVHHKDPLFWQGQFRRGGIILVLLLVTIPPFLYFYDFEKESLLDNPQRVNQYYKSSLKSREDIGRIVGRSLVLLDSSIPTYTGLANIATLFSNIRLAISPAFLKFFFMENVRRPDDYFCAPIVLTSVLYTDIYDKNDEEILHQDDEFTLSKNDLILFFNNDTFAIKHSFNTEFMKKRSYIQARKLSGDTIIHVCSWETRTVRFMFKYTALAEERVFNLLTSPGRASSSIVFGKEGRLTTQAFPLLKGVNQIELRPESAGEAVEILGISTMSGG